MTQCGFEQSAIFEHRFWLQILGDHSRFIFNSLSPNENEAIQEAQCFIDMFDQLLCQARGANSYLHLTELTGYACEYANKLHCFKLELLQRQLLDKIVTSLTPTFINHMLNELEEYLKILECLLCKQPPPLNHPIHHHLLWVPDAMAHAGILTSRIDLPETSLKETGQCFEHNFKNLYIKALELKGLLRTGDDEFPALTRYNLQVEKEIQSFNTFLCNLLNLVSTNQALSNLTSLTPDHMLREECYFLIKLTQVTEVSMPECDPTKPRIED